LRGAGVGKNAAKPEDVVSGLACRDVFGFGGGCSDALLLFGDPVDCSAGVDEDRAAVGTTSVGAGGPVGPGLEICGVGGGRPVGETEIDSATEVATW